MARTVQSAEEDREVEVIDFRSIRALHQVFDIDAVRIARGIGNDLVLPILAALVLLEEVRYIHFRRHFVHDGRIFCRGPFGGVPVKVSVSEVCKHGPVHLQIARLYLVVRPHLHKVVLYGFVAACILYSRAGCLSDPGPRCRALRRSVRCALSLDTDHSGAGFFERVDSGRIADGHVVDIAERTRSDVIECGHPVRMFRISYGDGVKNLVSVAALCEHADFGHIVPFRYFQVGSIQRQLAGRIVYDFRLCNRESVLR